MSRKNKKKLLGGIIILFSIVFVIRAIIDSIGIVAFYILVGLVIAIIAILYIKKYISKNYSQKLNFYKNESPIEKGEKGEQEIASLLEKISSDYQGLIINNVIITVNGKSSQIDHIFIHKSGIYVIETKNYDGLIFGEESNHFWTQVFPNSNQKNKFYNPVLQNNVHIERLQELLNYTSYFISLVVFVKGNIDFIYAKNIFSPDSLKKCILSNINNNHLSEDQIIFFYNKINEFKTNPSITIEEHIDNIHK